MIYMDNCSILTLKHRIDCALLCILDKRGVNSMAIFKIKVWFSFRAKKLDICKILTLRFHHTRNSMVLIVIHIILITCTVSKIVVGSIRVNTDEINTPMLHKPL